jgi:hypothetical protein
MISILFGSPADTGVGFAVDDGDGAVSLNLSLIDDDGVATLTANCEMRETYSHRTDKGKNGNAASKERLRTHVVVVDDVASDVAGSVRTTSPPGSDFTSTCERRPNETTKRTNERTNVGQENTS